MARKKKESPRAEEELKHAETEHEDGWADGCLACEATKVALEALEEPAESEPEEPTEPVPEVDEALYTVGKWKGRDNYECKQCPYSSLDKGKVAEHIYNRHINPPTTTRLVGPDGEPLRR